MASGGYTAAATTSGGGYDSPTAAGAGAPDLFALDRTARLYTSASSVALAASGAAGQPGGSGSSSSSGTGSKQQQQQQQFQYGHHHGVPDTAARTIVVHAMEILRHKSGKYTAHEQYCALQPGNRDAIAFPVTAGTTLEVDIAQFWSSLGDTLMEAEVRFLGCSVSPSAVAINPGDVFVPVTVTPSLHQVALRPVAKLTHVRSVFYPDASSMDIAPLPARDTLINGRRQFALTLKYKLNLAEACSDAEITVPRLHGALYDSPFESMIVIVTDEHGALLGMTDAFAETLSLPKGEVNVALQVRHEDIAKLEKLKSAGAIALALQLDRSIRKADIINVNICATQAEATATPGGGSGMGAKRVQRGQPITMFVAAPNLQIGKSPLPKWVSAGDQLVGYCLFEDYSSSISSLGMTAPSLEQGIPKHRRRDGPNTGAGRHPVGHPLIVTVASPSTKSSSGKSSSSSSSSGAAALSIEGLITTLRDAALAKLKTLDPLAIPRVLPAGATTSNPSISIVEITEDSNANAVVSSSESGASAPVDASDTAIELVSSISLTGQPAAPFHPSGRGAPSDADTGAIQTAGGATDETDQADEDNAEQDAANATATAGSSSSTSSSELGGDMFKILVALRSLVGGQVASSAPEPADPAVSSHFELASRELLHMFKTAPASAASASASSSSSSSSPSTATAAAAGSSSASEDLLLSTLTALVPVPVSLANVANTNMMAVLRAKLGAIDAALGTEARFKWQKPTSPGNDGAKAKRGGGAKAKARGQSIAAACATRLLDGASSVAPSTGTRPVTATTPGVNAPDSDRSLGLQVLASCVAEIAQAVDIPALAQFYGLRHDEGSAGSAQSKLAAEAKALLIEALWRQARALCEAVPAAIAAGSSLMTSGALRPAEPLGVAPNVSGSNKTFLTTGLPWPLSSPVANGSGAASSSSSTSGSGAVAVPQRHGAAQTQQHQQQQQTPRQPSAAFTATVNALGHWVDLSSGQYLVLKLEKQLWAGSFGAALETVNKLEKAASGDAANTSSGSDMEGLQLPAVQCLRLGLCSALGWHHVSLRVAEKTAATYNPPKAMI